MINAMDELFARRTPEAVARQCACVLAWLAECELATLESLKARKSSSHLDIRRHEGICERAVFHCFDLAIPPAGLLGAPCPRLAERLQVLKSAQSAQKSGPSPQPVT